MVKALLVTVYWNGHVFNPRAKVKKGRPRAQPGQSVPRWNGSLWPCPKQAFRDTAFKNQSSISLSIKAKHQQKGNSTGPGRWINLHSKELTQSKGITLVSICHSSSYRFPNNNTVQSFHTAGNSTVPLGSNYGFFLCSRRDSERLTQLWLPGLLKPPYISMYICNKSMLCNKVSMVVFILLFQSKKSPICLVHVAGSVPCATRLTDFVVQLKHSTAHSAAYKDNGTALSPG